MPSSAYLLSRYSITIDDGQPFTSRQIRLNEHFEFEFEHQGRMVSALFETCGLVMEGEKYRLTIGGKHVFEGQMTVEHWWKSQFFGVLTGMTIGISGLGLAWFLF